MEKFHKQNLSKRSQIQMSTYYLVPFLSNTRTGQTHSILLEIRTLDSTHPKEVGVVWDVTGKGWDAVHLCRHL